MDSSDGPWRITRSAPVRADAEGMFVPIHDVAGATIGDRVIISGPDAGDAREGVIAELTENADQLFFRVELDR
jgi:hypothetical protein